VNAPERKAEPGVARDEPPADEEYARTYAAGYEEGVRGALREVLEHLTRGHTPQEIRMLIQGRLARLAEEVEVKRRALLAPPQRTFWGPPHRAPGTAPGRPGEPARAGPLPALERGRSLLVREERPRRALEILQSEAARFPRVAIVSLRPPDLPRVPSDRTTVISVRDPGSGPQGRLTPGEVGGRLKAPTEEGALVYVDALEFFVTEDGAELTFRFVNWLVEQVQRTGSALLVSFDVRALDAKEASRLERAFAQVVGGT
jgi:hypothetical protein